MKNGCANPFEGCTPNVNCPYFQNPSSPGTCESGPNIAQGVFTAYFTLDECCEEIKETYPTYSSCDLALTAQPTANPSLPFFEITTPATPRPNQTDQVDQSNNADDNAADEVPLESNDKTEDEVTLAPIPVVFYNLGSKFDFNIIRKAELVETIQDTLADKSDDLNVTISQITIAEESGLDDSDKLSLQLVFILGPSSRKLMELDPAEIREELLGTLQDNIHEIGKSLLGKWGGEITTSGGIIVSIGDDIGGVGDNPRTTSTPTQMPSPNEVDVIAAPVDLSNYGGGDDAKAQTAVPIWAIILLSIVLTILCCGMLAWQRRQEKDRDGQVQIRGQFINEETIESSRLPVPRLENGREQSKRVLRLENGRERSSRQSRSSPMSRDPKGRSRNTNRSEKQSRDGDWLPKITEGHAKNSNGSRQSCSVGQSLDQPQQSFPNQLSQSLTVGDLNGSSQSLHNESSKFQLNVQSLPNQAFNHSYNSISIKSLNESQQMVGSIDEKVHVDHSSAESKQSDEISTQSYHLNLEQIDENEELDTGIGTHRQISEEEVKIEEGYDAVRKRDSFASVDHCYSVHNLHHLSLCFYFIFVGSIFVVSFKWQRHPRCRCQ